MKKIMYFVNTMSMGGAETLVKDYLMNIDKNKYELVLLLMFKNNTPYEKILTDNNIRIIYVQDGYNKNILKRIFNKIIRYIKVKKIISLENPDILHFHLALEKYVLFSNPKKKCKIFKTVHSEPKRVWNNHLNSRIDKIACKILVSKYNMRFIVLHDRMKNEVDEMFKVNNSIVVNNGINFKKFCNAKSSIVVRDKLNIPNESFIVGHIGRFNVAKNHMFLIEIFNEITKLNKNAFLLLIGTGEEKEKIINKLHEYSLDLKYKILENRTDIPDLLNAMDVFVFPSIYEGLPVTLVEAQKMKVPCFVSSNIDNYTFISNLITTISLDDSAEKWANTIINYKYPNKLKIEDEEWNIEKVVDKLGKIYDEKL